jgi:DNA-binding protein HU-beta
MNKNELISKVAGKTGYTKKDTGVVIDAVVEAITETVASGEKVSIVGFGTFEVTEREARTGRNPKTGEAIEIAASKSPKFKAGSAFKTAVNG